MNKMNTTLYKSIALAFFFGFLSQSSFAQIFWFEDFTNGIPSDWGNVDLLDNNGEWTWCDDPTEMSGGGCPGVTIGQTAFGATTAGSGFVTVASDEIGSGNNTHTSELTTSAINCSSYSEVWISFETTIGIYVMQASSNVFLQVSSDSVSWENYLIFPTLNGTDVWSENPELITMDLTEAAAGESTVYLRWRWQAGWEYYWNLDDINLYESNPAPPHDLRVNTNWFATFLNSMTPGSQVEPFGFMADVENVGSADQTNASLNMKIVNNADPSTSLYDESIDFDTVFVGELEENQLFPDEGFLPDSDPGVYTAVYTVTADSMDANFSNNQITFGFEVTDSIFAKDSGLANATGGAPPTNVWGPNEPYSWAYGNYYYLPNGEGMYATKASFGLANANDPGISGKQINVRLYKWNSDNDGGEDMDPTERDWIGSAIYTIVGDESPTDMITVPLYTPVNNNPIELEDDAAYVLMLEYAATDQTIVAFMITQDTDYAPTIYRSQELGEPRYAALVAFGEPLSGESYNSFGFGRDVVPVARLHVSEYPLLTRVDEVLSSDNKLRVYPNPADDFIQVSISLVEQHDNAGIEMVDLNGKVMKHRSLENLQETQFKFSLEGLPNGSYFINLNTPEGQRTVPFSKVK